MPYDDPSSMEDSTRRTAPLAAASRGSSVPSEFDCPVMRGPHYTHVYLLHAVYMYCQTLLASQLDFVT